MQASLRDIIALRERKKAESSLAAPEGLDSLQWGVQDAKCIGQQFATKGEPPKLTLDTELRGARAVFDMFRQSTAVGSEDRAASLDRKQLS